MPRAKKAVRKPTKQAVKSKDITIFGHKLSRFHLLSIAALLIFAGVGAYLTFFSNANPADHNHEPVKPFVEDPKRGLSWKGLRAGKVGTPCEKLYEIVDKHGKVQGCTHGPDPAPAGIDASVSAEPTSNGDTTISASTTSGIPCEGDGQTGNRTELIYTRASDKPDRYDQYLSTFHQSAIAANNLFIESSQQTGSLRQVRYVQDPTTCMPIVARTTVSPTGDDSEGNLMAELRAQGFNRSDRHYLVYLDATIFCGEGNLAIDDRPTADNRNNLGNIYSTVGSGCWGPGMYAAHEMMHSFGGVQWTAPHSTGRGHCTDEWDEMCYSDATGVSMNYTCPSTQQYVFDCNKDDYFNSSPNIPSTNWLATHWNSANSLYLIRGGDVAPPPSDSVVPTVTISSPTPNTQIGSQVNISAQATDNIGVVKMEVYIDGGLKATSTSGSIFTRWKTGKASRGFHSILVKAYDAAGNSGQSSVTVIK